MTADQTALMAHVIVDPLFTDLLQKCYQQIPSNERIDTFATGIEDTKENILQEMVGSANQHANENRYPDCCPSILIERVDALFHHG